MNPETLEALKVSIAKWERNAVAETPREYLIGPGDCALCEMFLTSNPACTGCPVAGKTGYGLCEATPYCAAETAQYKWEWGYGTPEAAHAAARKEAAFLKSLLPEGD